MCRVRQKDKRSYSSRFIVRIFVAGSVSSMSVSGSPDNRRIDQSSGNRRESRSYSRDVTTETETDTIAAAIRGKKASADRAAAVDHGAIVLHVSHQRELYHPSTGPNSPVRKLSAMMF